MNSKRKNGVRLNTRHLGVELLEDRRLLAIMLDGVPSSEYEAFAADPMFESVGAIYENVGTGWRRGSAVLIAPDWLLTAGHNLFGTDGVSDVSEVRFYTGLNIFESYEVYQADAWYVYPGYSGSMSYGQGVDLGLIHLSEPIVDISPAVLFSGEDQRGTLMYMAGYGAPGTPNTGVQPFDGKERAGNNIAEGFGGDDVLTYGVESQYWTASFTDYDPNLQPLEWMTSPGDSGCGWFANIGGQMQLVGINSGYIDDLGHGNSLAIRTSLHIGWITDTMAAHSPLSVTIATAAAQPPLTNNAPVLFSATFSAAVTDFDASDVIASGAPGTFSYVVTPVGTGGTTYNIAVSGMTGDGQVVVSIPAGAAHNAGGNGSSASTALDSGVTYDVTPPGVAVADVLTNDATPMLSGAASDANGVSGVSVTVGAQTFAGVLNAADGIWSAEVPASLLDGAYTATVTVTDNAGNVSTDTATVTVNTHPWHNSADPCNVDGRSGVEPVDVLLIINYINAHSSGPLPEPGPDAPPPYIDVNADDDVTPVDVLLVINWINRQTAGGSGEAEAWSDAAAGVFAAPAIKPVAARALWPVSDRATWVPAGLPNHGEQAVEGVAGDENPAPSAVGQSVEAADPSVSRSRRVWDEAISGDWSHPAVLLDAILNDIVPSQSGRLPSLT